MIYTLTTWMLKLPDALLLWMSGQPQMEAAGGRKMDPANQLLLLASLKRKTLFIDESKSAPELRALWKEQLAPFEKPPNRSVAKRDLQVEAGDGETIPVREYTPAGVPDTAPALVYLHGGGFTAFDIDVYQGFCEFLAQRLGIKIYSVGYRLAPEHPFPIPLEDCCAAFAWVSRNADELGLDPDRISIGGDSAGGNLSAALCLKRRDAAESLPRAQLLLYPLTDLSAPFEEKPNRFPSVDEFEEGQIIGRKHLQYMNSNYVPDRAGRTHPHASPLCAKSHAGLPPAVIITAGFDPLRDEGQAYAAALTKAGVPTQHKEFSDLGHGFIVADASARVREANEALCALVEPLL